MLESILVMAGSVIDSICYLCLQASSTFVQAALVRFLGSPSIVVIRVLFIRKRKRT